MTPTSSSSGPWRLRVLNILCFLDLGNEFHFILLMLLGSQQKPSKCWVLDAATSQELSSFQKGFLITLSATPVLQTPLNSMYCYIQIMIITFSETVTSFPWELFQNTLLQARINCAQAFVIFLLQWHFYIPFGMQWHLNRYLPHQKSLGLTVKQTCKNWTLHQWPQSTPRCSDA